MEESNKTPEYYLNTILLHTTTHMWEKEEMPFGLDFEYNDFHTVNETIKCIEVTDQVYKGVGTSYKHKSSGSYPNRTNSGGNREEKPTLLKAPRWSALASAREICGSLEGQKLGILSCIIHCNMHFSKD